MSTFEKYAYFVCQCYDRNSEGEFGRPFVKASAKKLLGWKWWVEFGSECPELQSVAQKVLSQISCASACERN